MFNIWKQDVATPLTENALKIASIISSCSKQEQLTQAWIWIGNIVNRNCREERLTYAALELVLCCKYYGLIRDKKTLPWNLKVELPPVEEGLRRTK